MAVRQLPLPVRVCYVVPAMPQRDAVELLKRIHDALLAITTGSSEPTIERNALHLGSGDVYALRLLDVAEVDSVDTTALVGDDGWLLVA